MSDSGHIGMVQALYSAFQAGHIAAILDLVADDFSLELPPMPDVPWRSSYPGKEGLREFLVQRGPLVTYTYFSPDQFFADRGYVLVVGETAGVARVTERAFRYKWVHIFQFSPNSLISRMEEVLDTHVLVTAFSERSGPAPSPAGRSIAPAPGA
jgi:ketosteroid isomerase-like protein